MKQRLRIELWVEWVGKSMGGSGSLGGRTWPSVCSLIITLKSGWVGLLPPGTWGDWNTGCKNGGLKDGFLVSESIISVLKNHRDPERLTSQRQIIKVHSKANALKFREDEDNVKVILVQGLVTFQNQSTGSICTYFLSLFT